jgi:hypothetical protein
MAESSRFARKRMADWCPLARWEKSCRVRVSSYIVLGLDGVESNHGRVARDFHNFHGFQKTGDVGSCLCKIAARTFTPISLTIGLGVYPGWNLGLNLPAHEFFDFLFESLKT